MQFDKKNEKYSWGGSLTGILMLLVALSQFSYDIDHQTVGWSTIFAGFPFTAAAVYFIVQPGRNT